MANTLAQKLRIKEGYTLLPINTPKDFKKSIGGLPAGVKISPGAKKYDQVHWFVLNKTQFEKELPKVLKLVKGDVLCWIYYPKGTSKLQTDLNRDTGLDELLKHNLQFISLISFDDIWSAFGIREKAEAVRKKEAQQKVREVFDWVDPKTKTVKVPEDLDKALRKNSKLKTYFESLAFSHKKEYIEWIVTARREETRKARVKGTIERLEKGWKNPRNI